MSATLIGFDFVGPCHCSGALPQAAHMYEGIPEHARDYSPPSRLVI